MMNREVFSNEINHFRSLFVVDVIASVQRVQINRAVSEYVGFNSQRTPVEKRSRLTGREASGGPGSLRT